MKVRIVQNPDYTQDSNGSASGHRQDGFRWKCNIYLLHMWCLWGNVRFLLSLYIMLVPWITTRQSLGFPSLPSLVWNARLLCYHQVLAKGAHPLVIYLMSVSVFQSIMDYSYTFLHWLNFNNVFFALQCRGRSNCFDKASLCMLRQLKVCWNQWQKVHLCYISDWTMRYMAKIGLYNYL